MDAIKKFIDNNMKYMFLFKTALFDIDIDYLDRDCMLYLNKYNVKKQNIIIQYNQNIIKNILLKCDNSDAVKNLDVYMYYQIIVQNNNRDEMSKYDIDIEDKIIKKFAAINTFDEIIIFDKYMKDNKQNTTRPIKEGFLSYSNTTNINYGRKIEVSQEVLSLFLSNKYITEQCKKKGHTNVHNSITNISICMYRIKTIKFNTWNYGDVLTKSENDILSNETINNKEKEYLYNLVFRIELKNGIMMLLYLESILKDLQMNTYKNFSSMMNMNDTNKYTSVNRYDMKSYELLEKYQKNITDINNNNNFDVNKSNILLLYQNNNDDNKEYNEIKNVLDEYSEFIHNVYKKYIIENPTKNNFAQISINNNYVNNK